MDKGKGNSSSKPTTVSNFRPEEGLPRPIMVME